MIKRLIIVFLLAAFVTGGAMAAKKKDVNKFKYNSEAAVSDNGPAKTPVPIKYSPGIINTATCNGISTVIPIVEHTQIGDTWYDYQQNGSMGRMISVSSDGCRHTVWHYTSGVYGGTVYRYVKSNEAPAGAAPLSWIGAQNVDGGAGINAGYANQTHLSDGTSISIYHRTAGSPIWYSAIAAEDSACDNIWNRHWDIPDYIEGATSGIPGEWPKGEVQYDPTIGRDYIHIVAQEGITSGDVAMMIYERCYIADVPGFLDTMICQTYRGGATQTCKVVAGANGPGTFFTVSPFDSSCEVSPIVAVSPVDRSVAVVYLKPNDPLGTCEYFQDVWYFESTDCGDDWIDGVQWPPVKHNITQYGSTDLERADRDVAACYDYQDSLHIVWSAGVWGGPSDPTTLYYRAYMYHWSKKDGKSMIAFKLQDYCYPVAHHLDIAKVGISAQDPVYHPTGDSVYLYATWVQFDSADVSAATHGNGDLWACGSNNGGYNWGGKFNITNTNTNGCAAGACVSEDWPSQASNMYNGNLQMEYICDKDPGSCIHGEGAWTDNPVYYLELEGGSPSPPCLLTVQIISPPSWYNPPLKVTPGGSRTLIFRVCNIGNNSNCYYSVSGDDPCMLSNVPLTHLTPGECDTITAVISGSVACNGTFIDGNIIITTSESGRPPVYLPVQAVVTNDYYECPRDPVTYDTLDNGILRFYVNANTQEWIHDIGTFPDTIHNVFFEGGPFVATTESNDTLVGRYYGYNDEHALAREYLHLNTYSDFWLEYSWNVSIHDLNPPMDTKWWWFEILHENVFFKPSAPDALKHCVIKFITVERHDPPGWWPSHPAFTGYDDTYIGSFMDIDAPYDTCCMQSARNLAGYDATNNIAWTKGWDYTGAHPQYNDYYAGMALIAGQQAGESTVPYGTYNLRNDVHLYPQSPWGWKDGGFYRLAKGNVIGVIEQPDSIVDRSQIVTARHIPASNDLNARASLTLVEVSAPGGLSQLQSYVGAARAWVANKPTILCGDANNSGIIEVGDIVTLISYLYKNGPEPVGPKMRGDTNHNEEIDIGDIVCMITFLYRNGPPCRCTGVW